MDNSPAGRLSRVAALALFLGAPAAALAQPAGAVVFSVDADRGQCIVTRPSPDGGFDVLALGSCAEPAALFLVDEAAKRVRVARDPSLCFSDATGAGAAPFGALVRECSDDTVGQFYAFDGRTGRFRPHDATGAPDDFCYYAARPQRGIALILANLCNLPAVRSRVNAFTRLPGRE